MIFLPTTHFRVLKPSQDFPLDFQITHQADYVCTVMNSNNETYCLSPLVIEHRLRRGHIAVIAFPVHSSHRMECCTPKPGVDGPITPQCCGCMLLNNEEQIQFECALPVREILGPESFGGDEYRPDVTHPWIKDGPGPRLPDTRMPILVRVGPGENTICPACVLGDPRIRLCVDHKTSERAETAAWLRERIRTVPPSDLGARLLSEISAWE